MLDHLGSYEILIPFVCSYFASYTQTFGTYKPRFINNWNISVLSPLIHTLIISCCWWSKSSLQVISWAPGWIKISLCFVLSNAQTLEVGGLSKLRKKYMKRSPCATLLHSVTKRSERKSWQIPASVEHNVSSSKGLIHCGMSSLEEDSLFIRWALPVPFFPLSFRNRRRRS